MDNNRRHLGWIQFTLAAILFLLFAPALLAWTHDQGAHSMLIPIGTPTVTTAQLRTELARVKDEFSGDAGSTVESYFVRLMDGDKMEAVLKKYLQSHPDIDRLDSMHGLRPPFDSYNSWTMELQQRYLEKFGQTAMSAAAYSSQVQAITATHLSPQLPELPSTAWPLFLKALIASLVTALFYFGVAVKRNEMNVWLELDRIMMAAVSWPYSIFKYPVALDLAEQAARMRRRLATAFAVLLSAAPLGALAKASAEGSSEANSSSNTLVVDESWLPMPALTFSVGVASSKIAPNGVIVHSGTVINWDAHAQFDDGWSFDHSGTRALAGSKGSDENDYGIGWNKQIGPRTSLSLNLSFYDIQPKGSTKGGDFVAPAFELDRDMGHGFTGFITGEYDGLTAHNENAGYTLRLGERRGWDLGDGFNVSESALLVEAGGPFKHPTGTLFRFDTSLSKKLTSHLSATLLWVKGLAPLAGAHDRTPDIAFGTSLSLATN